ncbi:glycosyl hydrolase family 61-domain-containing protein [Coprinopsis sp. MPI-PUGE-AT-0042]|nr:glycosyl hydrolase family 61-domain-containing protein [Coprinopsis sp. MPI-PUGE-AT-0042]
MVSLPFPIPTSSPLTNIFFPIPGPVENLNLLDFRCNSYIAAGVSPAPAPLVGLIASGSNITFHWTSWPDNHKGPVITYMACVPDGQDLWTRTPGRDEKVWFKVHEIGKNKEGKWASEGLAMGANSLVSVRVPKRSRKGVYIVRHEMGLYLLLSSVSSSKFVTTTPALSRPPLVSTLPFATNQSLFDGLNPRSRPPL